MVVRSGVIGVFPTHSGNAPASPDIRPTTWLCPACIPSTNSIPAPISMTTTHIHQLWLTRPPSTRSSSASEDHPQAPVVTQQQQQQQRRSTDQPNTKSTAPTEHPRATTVRKCPECKRCLAQVRSPLVCVACRQQFHVKCVRKPNWLCWDWGLQMHGLAISVHLCRGPSTNRPRLTALLICQSKTNIASLFCNGTVIAWPPKLLNSANLQLDMALTSLPYKRPS